MIKPSEPCSPSLMDALYLSYLGKKPVEKSFDPWKDFDVKLRRSESNIRWAAHNAVRRIEEYTDLRRYAVTPNGHSVVILTIHELDRERP